MPRCCARMLLLALSRLVALTLGGSALLDDPAPLPNLFKPTIYSIGDLHGDYERFRMILEGLGLATFDEEDSATWTGGTAVLVSTGDTVDRGDHSRAIFRAFRELARGAEAAGGEVVNVLGNHDLMNLQGDWRYVSKLENSSEGDYGGFDARREDWSPRGEVGADVRSRFVAAAVRGDILFVHAGLHPRWLEALARRFPLDPVGAINNVVRPLLQPENVGKSEPIFGVQGPFWAREFAMGKEERICPILEKSLRLTWAKRMVVGHTIQKGGVRGRCNSAYGPRLILGDTAISRAYKGNGVQSVASAVEYLPDGTVTAIHFDDQGGQQRGPVQLLGSKAGTGAAVLGAAVSGKRPLLGKEAVPAFIAGASALALFLRACCSPKRARLGDRPEDKAA